MNDPRVPHVVQVVHRLDVGGLENGVVNIVNRMPAGRYCNTVVCLAGYGVDFRKRIRRDDVEVLSLDKRPGKDLRMYGRMFRLLKRLRPDVVHTRNLGTVDMQWVAAVAGVPARVHGEHGWEASDPQGLNRKSRRIRRACRPVIHRYVPMSRDIARWLEREVGVPRVRIRQLYNGVDTERFAPVGHIAADVPWARSARFDSRLSTGNPLVVGTVGRLDAVKNQVALLKAVRAVLDSCPELNGLVKVLLVGDGPMRPSLELAVGGLRLDGQVWFAGMRSDTPEILRALDVFVLPSINEGISNTILEAMATSLPVLASRVGGNVETVVDGVTGTLYREGDPGQLADSLQAYLTDAPLRRRHGDAARARVLQCFSLDAMVTRYADLYDEVLRSPRPSGNRQPNPIPIE